jgi:hypothetical protein
MLDFATQLAWLLTMAKCPGFKAYAWRRAQDLEAMFPGIALALTNAMKESLNASDR